MISMPNLRLPLLLLLLLLPTTFFAKGRYKRQRFDYASMKLSDDRLCEEKVHNEVLEAFALLDRQQSGTALGKTEALRGGKQLCVGTEAAYAYSLFQNGQPIAAGKAIDAAIKRFGPDPILIKIRASQCLEMAENGVGVVSVDGMSKFLPKKDALPFDDAQFKLENLQCAASDLEYLTKADMVTDDAKPGLLWNLAMVYRELKDYAGSDATLRLLLEEEDFAADALKGLVKNAVLQGDDDGATRLLDDALAENPRDKNLYRLKVEVLSKQTGKEAEVKDAKDRANFYAMAPSYLRLSYSAANLALLTKFADEKVPEEEKIQALQSLAAMPQADRVDILVAILHMHMNHGNSVEGRAVEMLGNEGKPASASLLGLLDHPTSTCAITYAGLALAHYKDEEGWERLVAMLPEMDRLAASLLPPSIPLCLFQFDSLRALDALLPSYLQRTRALAEVSEEDNPLGGLATIFVDGTYFQVFGRYPREFLASRARGFGYNEEEVAELVKKSTPHDLDELLDGIKTNSDEGED